MIDLRSDTVTRPTEAMRRVMAEAEVGDDVYGEDPSVNRLQQRAAELIGFEAALFVPSGTMSNLLAILAHCERGDEYLVGQMAHCYRFEGGGAAVLGSVQPQPLPQNPDGSIPLAELAAAVKPDDAHFARSRLVCLENTFQGRLLPADYRQQVADFCRQKGLALHLDGARLANAAVAEGRSLREMTAGFDSVSLCLSKGLGAPVGSVLCGSAGLIARAHRWRKVLGGGMRQAGVLAAAGLYALDHHIERLAEDHRRARRLAEGLARLPGLSVDPDAVETNMVFVDSGHNEAFLAHLRHQGILAGGYGRVRLVTHLDIDDAAIDAVITAAAGFCAARGC